MGGIRELVLVFTTNIKFFGDGLGSEAHVEVVIGLIGGDGIGRYCLPSGLWHHRHAFRTAGDDTICHSAADLGCRHGDRLQTTGAIAVDGDTGCVDTDCPGGDDAADL